MGFHRCSSHARKIDHRRVTKGASIEDYLEVIQRTVEHCGGRVNLIGDCQRCSVLAWMSGSWTRWSASTRITVGQERMAMRRS